MISLTPDFFIADDLIVAFGKVGAEIKIALRDAEPGSLLHHRLQDRLAQVEAGWRAFRGARS